MKTIIVMTAVWLCALVQSAAADEKSEIFIDDSARALIVALQDPVDSDAKVALLLDDLVDLEKVARFSLGKYVRRLSASEIDLYQSFYRQFSMASYKFYLSKYGVQRITVIDSIDRSATDSVVQTEVFRSDTDSFIVFWRVLKIDGQHKIVDLALEEHGNRIWLGIEQRAQTVAILDKVNGRVDVLINKLQISTRNMQIKLAQVGGPDSNRSIR